MPLRSCPVRSPQAQSVPLNVIIPMGGLSANAFTEENYRVPKPMVPIVGRPMLFWLLDNLALEDGDHVWVGLQRTVEAEFGIEDELRREFPQLSVHFVRFDFETRGVTETLYCILNAMDETSKSRRTISLDSDTLFFCDVLGGARALPAGHGASFCFTASDSETALFSYIRADEATSEVVEIREKVAISRLANCGAYAFPSARCALEGLEALLDEACAMGSEDASAILEERGKQYVSGLIAHLMRDLVTFWAVRAENFADLGSPAKLRAFAARLRAGDCPVKKPRKMRFCFGLDGTLVREVGRERCEPIARNVALVRELHAAGHTIIILTDRGARGDSMAQRGKLTFEQLENFGIPYDEIVFGNPKADAYVDARACNSSNAEKLLAQALGWGGGGGGSSGDSPTAAAAAATPGGFVEPRHFNTLRRVGDDHVEKTGPRHILRGEAYWYRHIPAGLEDVFPKAVTVTEHPAQDLSSILMTKVVGVTYSHLIVNGCLTTGRLRVLLDSLKRIHATPGEEEEISDALLCSNYRAKVEQRYGASRALFESFTQFDTVKIARTVLELLGDYEEKRRFKRSAFIHGDPVFSNALLSADSRVKFLDMRGALGDRCTTAGDVSYDVSKVYQSLCGYDFTILDVEKDGGAWRALARLQEFFKTWLAETYVGVSFRDIRILTAAHFFCIVPLHENREHQTAFLQSAVDILVEDGLLA